MRRREFITLAGGSALAWPLAAYGQQPGRMRRVGVLMILAETDPRSSGVVAAFKRRLEEAGWSEGRNVRIDFLWGRGDPDAARAGAKELVGLQPDVIVAETIVTARALQQETHTIPIVFTIVSDPRGAGLIESIARPGANITGFTNMEPTMGAKWLEVLREFAPRVTRVAVLLDPERTPTAIPFSRSAEAAAKKFEVKAFMVAVHNREEIESILTMLGREPGGGFIVPPDVLTYTHRKLIVELAARNLLPGIYAYRVFTAIGGLVSYGTDLDDQLPQTATYVDRILRGDNPGELPVQAPTKFKLVINLRTAKALGLDIAPMLLARADEVIE